MSGHEVDGPGSPRCPEHAFILNIYTNIKHVQMWGPRRMSLVPMTGYWVYLGAGPIWRGGIQDRYPYSACMRLLEGSCIVSFQCLRVWVVESCAPGVGSTRLLCHRREDPIPYLDLDQPSFGSTVLQCGMELEPINLQFGKKRDGGRDKISNCNFD